MGGMVFERRRILGLCVLLLLGVGVMQCGLVVPSVYKPLGWLKYDIAISEDATEVDLIWDEIVERVDAKMYSKEVMWELVEFSLRGSEGGDAEKKLEVWRSFSKALLESEFLWEVYSDEIFDMAMGEIPSEREFKEKWYSYVIYWMGSKGLSERQARHLILELKSAEDMDIEEEIFEILLFSDMSESQYQEVMVFAFKRLMQDRYDGIGWGDSSDKYSWVNGILDSLISSGKYDAPSVYVLLDLYDKYADVLGRDEKISEETKEGIYCFANLLWVNQVWDDKTYLNFLKSIIKYRVVCREVVSAEDDGLYILIENDVYLGELFLSGEGRVKLFRVSINGRGIRWRGIV